MQIHPRRARQFCLPLAAANNTIMLRHDENNTGKMNLDSMQAPYKPSI